MAGLSGIKRKARKLKRWIRIKRADAYYYHQYYNAKIDDSIVLIESKNGEDIASNMYYILKELQKPEYNEYKVYIAVSQERYKALKAVIDNYKFKNANLTVRKSKEYLKLLCTAKYLFTDTSFPGFFVKRDGQIYTNTWHGTPLKKMINDVPNRRYAMGNVKRNFCMCDYLLYPNDEMEEKMIGAYSMNELYQGKIINGGYPRNAVFFDEKRALEVRKELKFEGKYVSVYMPTWRGIMTNKAGEEQHRDIIDKLKELDNMLDDSHVVFAKMHVLVQQSLDFSSFKHIRSFPKGYETYDVLNSADCLITDYSSVFFDFANSRKKIVLFTYDKEEYISERGLYYDLEDLPFPKVETPEELCKALNAEKDYDDTEFIKKFCTYDNPNATEDLVAYIFKGKKSKNIKVKETKKNGNDNVLIYSGSLALNGMTTALVSLTKTIDLDKENIFVSFREKALKRDPLRTERLPKGVELYPMVNGFKNTYSELIASILYYKLNIKTRWITKKLDRMYTREWRRFYGDAKIDKVIQFMGYEKRVIGLYQRANCPRAIFVHNDMCQEIKSKGNQHKLTLQDAYASYDRVCCVTEDVKQSCLKLTKRTDNIMVVNNAHDEELILKKMEMDISFDDKTVSNVSEGVLKQLMDREDYIKFINIGRFSPEKGHKRLVDAFDKFYQENPKSYLIIIGGYGKSWNDINEYIKTKKCRFNVILIRYIKNPFPILKRCDLFILSSFYEALGLVVLEAQTCGVASISTDILGPRGFMLEHNGVLVENSEAGILKGMNDYMAGKVKLMDFDPVAYNANVKEEYENIFKF